MDSVDALGAQPGPLAALTGELLLEPEDIELQKIVTEASRELSTPIALVNLILEQVQFFKAHHGLPEDLASARGTDRNVSFCQFVVRDGQPFEVVDAETDERVPQHLVKYYSIKSYLGMPIMANDAIIGSLCVIDTKPRSFSEADRENLRELAGLVNARLAVLAERKKKDFLQKKAYHFSNTVAEISEKISLIKEEILPGKSAAVAIGVFLRLMEHNSQHQAIPKAIIEQTLVAAQEALVNCKESLSNIEISAEGAEASLAILEKVYNFSKSFELSAVIKNSLELMKPELAAVGGVSIVQNGSGYRILSPQAMAVSILSTTLALLSKRLVENGTTNGITINIQRYEDRVNLLLTAAGLNGETLEDLSSRLSLHIGANPNFTIRTAEEGIILTFIVSRETDTEIEGLN